MPKEDTQFKPGHKGMGGRPPINKRLKALTKEQMKEVGDLILLGTRDELLAVAKDSEAPMLKVWIASVVLMATKAGDMHTLDLFLNRLIGKVRDDIEISMPKPTIIEYEGSRLVLTSKMEKEE